jgi:multidrug efflux pump
MISSVFIDRPRLAIVIAIVIALGGLLALTRIPVAQLPDIVPPQVEVTGMYPGASAEVLEATVAQPLESKIIGVDKMIYMKSTSGNDGTYTLVVSFELGTDPDIDTVNVNNRVQTAIAQLPQEVQLQGIKVQKKSSSILQFINLYDESGKYDPLFITNFAIINILDELSRTAGVGEAKLFGGLNYSMRIWFDMARLTSLNLAPSDVIKAIQSQNVQASVGRIGARPVPENQQFQVNVQTQGRLVSPEQFGEIVLRTNADGSTLRIKDVARVELGAMNDDNFSRLNGRPAVTIGVFLSPGANALATANAVEATLDKLRARFPEGLKARATYDTTVFVKDTMHEVVKTLFEAFVLVALVVFVFLGQIRATIIPVIAVPVSLIGAFMVLVALGYSANTVSLLAMVLAIGIVVDDAIVVVENVERHIESGKSPRDAAHQAMSEVSGPIVAITLVLASVFVPLAFLGGVTGQFYKQFAVTIAAAVLISGFNSLTLSPALAALLLQPHGARKDALGRWIEKVFGRPFSAFNRVFHGFGDRYSSGIGGTISRAPRLLVIYAALLVVTFFGFRAVQGGYIPSQDKQYLFAILQLPEAATIDRTDAVMRRMGDIAMDVPGVANVVQFPGLNAVHFVATPNTGVMFLGLEPQGERELSAAEINARVNMGYSQIQDGLAFSLQPPPVLGLGNANGLELYVEDRASLGYGELYNQTMGLVGTLSNTKGFGFGTFTSYQSNVPQLDATVDRTKVKELGLSLTDVYSTLQVYLGSAYVNDFNLFGRTYSVYAQADAPYRSSVQDIQGLKVRNHRGEMVPLGTVVDIKPSYGPDPVIRYNGYAAADMSVSLNPAVYSTSDGLAKTSQIAEQILPRGMNIEWTGLTYQQVTQGNTALFVFPLCVLLVYLVLSALYESWSLPLAIILIVPMCLLSAIGVTWLINFLHGLWLMVDAPPYAPTFLDNNIFTKIGLAVLIGLACKNAILIVEFARDLEEAGKGIVDAAIEACRLRLRPILMTSFAFVAGVTPLVFASGAGAEVRYVMGVTVVSGMLGVTFFGLFFTPVFYVVLRKLVERQKERRAARLAAEASLPHA